MIRRTFLDANFLLQTDTAAELFRKHAEKLPIIDGRVEKCSATGRIGFKRSPSEAFVFHQSEVVAKSARSWALAAFGIAA